MYLLKKCDKSFASYPVLIFTTTHGQETAHALFVTKELADFKRHPIRSNHELNGLFLSYCPEPLTLSTIISFAFQRQKRDVSWHWYTERFNQHGGFIMSLCCIETNRIETQCDSRKHKKSYRRTHFVDLFETQNWRK